jgi:hypothetical protein
MSTAIDIDIDIDIDIPTLTVYVDQTLEELVLKYPHVLDLKKASLSGAEATLILTHHDAKVYKFTNKEDNHHGLAYGEGLIQDVKKFDIDVACNSGIYCAYSIIIMVYSRNDLNTCDLEIVSEMLQYHPIIGFMHFTILNLNEEQELKLVKDAIERGWEYMKDIIGIMVCPSGPYPFSP